MNLDKITQKFPKNSLPLILFGIIAGMLGLWIIGKILKPWVDPLIRTGCRTYLGRLNGEHSSVDRVVLVEAQDVQLGSVTRRITSVGKLRANAAVMLKAEMAGRIKSIHFSNGDEVQAGDLLIQLEDADLQAELRLSQAELMQKEADFQRITRLREHNVESAKRFDEARAAAEITRARVERAQAQLNKARIVAPFDGTMGIIDASVGTYLQAGQDLVMLVDNTPILVDFKVPERYLNEVGAGQQAEIKIDGLPDEIFNATVDAVDASIDPQSHTLAVRASLDNEEGRLRGGQFAHVSLIVGEKPEAMLVPESAVMREGNREFVWVAFQGKAVRAPVITGTREHTNVEILSGLRPGLSVIFTGQNRLAEGIPISIQESPAVAMLSEETTETEEAASEADTHDTSIQEEDPAQATTPPNTSDSEMLHDLNETDETPTEHTTLTGETEQAPLETHVQEARQQEEESVQTTAIQTTSHPEGGKDGGTTPTTHIEDAAVGVTLDTDALRQEQESITRPTGERLPVDTVSNSTQASSPTLPENLPTNSAVAAQHPSYATASTPDTTEHREEDAKHIPTSLEQDISTTRTEHINASGALDANRASEPPNLLEQD